MPIQKNYQQKFLKFALDSNALSFGDFTLKSGRISPYFFNAGMFNTGKEIAQLGKYYAQAIVNSGLEFDVLFGPSYKGVPLASVTSAYLYTEHNKNIGYSFNRKEAKSHGEKGLIVGSEISAKVLVIDDVITAGTSVNESVELIKQYGGTLVGVVIMLDRQERGQGETSAVNEIEQKHQVPVISVANLMDLTKFVSYDQNLFKRISEYRNKYGID